MGKSPCRRIPLLGIAHPIVEKLFQVLEAHQEIDTYEILVEKKSKLWLYFVLCKILDGLSSFYLCKRK